MRPKTSTGLRGSAIYSKMNTIDDINQNPNQTSQSITNSKMEKPDGIRT